MGSLRRLLLAGGGGGSFTIAPVSELLIDPAACGWTVVPDPKFVHGGGKTFIGWVDRDDGDAYVMSIDDTTGTQSTPFALHGSSLGGVEGSPDPHDSPAILILPSGKIAAAYSAHNGSTCYLRISTNAGDVTTFDAEQSLDAQLGGTAYTYMGLAYLSGEAKLYLFYRDQLAGNNGRIAYSTASSPFTTWAAQTTLFVPVSGQRAYRRMGSNGVDRIDIGTTNRDPSVAVPAGVFHTYWQSGNWHKSDGTTVTLPLAAADITEVDAGSSGSAWCSGFSYLAGNPIMLLLRQHTSTMDVHQRRWNGSAWVDYTVLDAVTGVYSNAYHPACMSVEDPDRVWITPLVGSFHETWRYTSADNGATWQGTAMTSGSSVHNAQPDPVWSAHHDTQVVWLHGTDTSGPTFNNGDWEVWGGY